MGPRRAASAQRQPRRQVRIYPVLRACAADPDHSFNGWAVTLIDALDTMWIMGLHDEFRDVIPLIANMTFAHDEVLMPEHSRAYDSVLMMLTPALPRRA